MKGLNRGKRKLYWLTSRRLSRKPSEVTEENFENSHYGYPVVPQPGLEPNFTQITYLLTYLPYGVAYS